MDVEQIAVSKVVGMISRCPHLIAQIAANDKTPFTDGHIDIYDGLGRNKKAWAGRVPVQVKGRTHRGKMTAFSISRTDLLGFQKESGVLYLVVTVDPKTHREIPYYALLAPFRIESLLSGVDASQQNVAVPVDPFPPMPAQIEALVALALRTRRQNPSLGFDPSLYEQIESFTVHSATDIDLDAPVTIDPGKQDVSLEIVTVGGMSVPVSGVFKMHPQRYVPTVRTLSIRCGGVDYAEGVVQQLDRERTEVVLAGGLRIVIHEDETQRATTFNLSLAGSVVDQVKAAEFFAALTTSRTIKFGEHTARYDDTVALEDAEAFQEQLEFLRKLRDLFARLEVDASMIDVDALTTKQTHHLLHLHAALVDGHEVGTTDTGINRWAVAIGDWHLLVLVVPGTTAGRARILDPFDPESPHVYRWDPDAPDAAAVPVTAYDVVDDEYLPTTLNLRLHRIVDAYDALADHASTSAVANARVIALIAAADAQPVRRVEFLDAALAVNEWIIVQEGHEDRHVLNRAQILWRLAELTDADRTTLRVLKRRRAASAEEDAAQVELACALLLDDVEEAALLCGELTPTQLTAMESWPIWNLHDKTLPAPRTVPRAPSDADLVTP